MSDEPEMQFNQPPQTLLTGPLPYAEIAAALFALLDDCDTADDIAKDNDELFRSLVRRAHRQRFKYATTDGYSVTFNTP